MSSLTRSKNQYDPVANIREWQSRQLEAVNHVDSAIHDNEIAHLCESLHVLFKTIVRVLSEQGNVSKDIQISLERSRSALLLWSDGCGIASGRLSEVFAGSRKLRYTVLKTLSHLGNTLVERLVPLANVWTEELRTQCLRSRATIEVVDTIITEDAGRLSDTSSSDVSSLISIDDINEIAEELNTDTILLAGLDPLLKYPIYDSDSADRTEEYVLSTWGPDKLYTDKIENRFPAADAALASLLGKANYQRYLRCQAERDVHEREKIVSLLPEDINVDGTILAASKFHDSGVGTSLGPALSYAETMMSYSHEGGHIRIPPLPKEAKRGARFPCTACGKFVYITNNTTWKRHIYLDLQPYMCLDISCRHSNVTYETREKWISHLALDHEMEPAWPSLTCPLCKEETGSGKLAITQHLSRHLEEISLSALPIGTEFDIASKDGSAESDNSANTLEGGSNYNHVPLNLELLFNGNLGFMNSWRTRPPSMHENPNTLWQNATPDQKFELDYPEDQIYQSIPDEMLGTHLRKISPSVSGYLAKSEMSHIETESAPEMMAPHSLPPLAVREPLNKEDCATERSEQWNPTRIFEQWNKSFGAQNPEVIFMDSHGRHWFRMPLEDCKTWQDLRAGVSLASHSSIAHREELQAGRYDLIGPDGNLLLPASYNKSTTPRVITIHIWHPERRELDLTQVSPSEPTVEYLREPGAGQMTTKKRIITVFDGQRRLAKDNMMLGGEHDVHNHITEETLRKANKNSNSSRSTRSSGSPDKSDYRYSATTRTTTHSGGNEDITTIRARGNIKVMIGDDEMQCEDGAEISFSSRRGPGYRGDKHDDKSDISDLEYKSLKRIERFFNSTERSHSGSFIPEKNEEYTKEAVLERPPLESRLQRRFSTFHGPDATEFSADKALPGNQSSDRADQSSMNKKLPIKFKDALGRKFSLPYHLCQTWQGMEELIKQAFLHVDVIGPHVQEGHYDLIGPNGDIILPTVWEKVIQPDWAITMHMWWPIDKVPLRAKHPDIESDGAAIV